MFRAHVNFETDSMLYPYDSQFPTLKLQSLDHGKDVINLRTRILNKLNGIKHDKMNNDWANITYLQDRILLTLISHQIFAPKI